MIYRNIEMIRGDTFPFLVSVKDSSGNPVDISAYSFRMTAKYEHSSDDLDAVFTLVSPGSIDKSDAANGNITVTISPASTQDLYSKEISLYYDIQMSLSATENYTLVQGRLKIYPDVTRTNPFL